MHILGAWPVQCTALDGGLTANLRTSSHNTKGRVSCRRQERHSKMAGKQKPPDVIRKATDGRVSTRVGLCGVPQTRADAV
jgi:hypothetical protein